MDIRYATRIDTHTLMSNHNIFRVAFDMPRNLDEALDTICTGPRVTNLYYEDIEALESQGLEFPIKVRVLSDNYVEVIDDRVPESMYRETYLSKRVAHEQT